MDVTPDRLLTRDDVLDMLAAAAAQAGSQAALARRWGMTPQNLSQTLRGHRPPGPKILAGLGLRARKVVGPGRKLETRYCRVAQEQL